MKYRTPLPGEGDIRFILRELNGNRVLIELICDYRIKPLETVALEEVSLAERLTGRPPIAALDARCTTPHGWHHGTVRTGLFAKPTPSGWPFTFRSGVKVNLDRTGGPRIDAARST